MTAQRLHEHNLLEEFQLTVAARDAAAHQEVEQAADKAKAELRESQAELRIQLQTVQQQAAEAQRQYAAVAQSEVSRTQAERAHLDRQATAHQAQQGAAMAQAYAAWQAEMADQKRKQEETVSELFGEWA